MLVGACTLVLSFGTRGFLGMKDVWNLVSILPLIILDEALNQKRETVHIFYCVSAIRRRAAPIATANSGPATASLSARKAGVSIFAKGFA